MDDPFHRPAFAPSLVYDDPRAALDWLSRAFGFEIAMTIEDGDGTLVHSEMRFRGALIYVGGRSFDFSASPTTLGGRSAHKTHVLLERGLDAHCERARAAGAEIIVEPCDQFYGDRAYVARDPQGHVWSFAEVVAKVSREDAEAATGLRIDGWW